MSAGGSCALGAVYDGVYHLPRDHGKLVPDHLERLFRCLDEVTKRCPAGLRQAAAAGRHDRAPERRPSPHSRADRRVAHPRKQRLARHVLSRPLQAPTPVEARRRRDPAAAVNELLTDDPEQRSALIELAGDEDLRVRRAALARIDSVEDLVRLSRTEPDEEAKRGLIERLVDIAISPADNDGDAALALGALDDEKQIATVAKNSPHETVRTAALGRVHDVRTPREHRPARRRPADRARRRRPGSGPGGTAEHRAQDGTQGCRRSRRSIGS